MDEVLELVAYKIRVMMSHVRNCYDGAKVDEKKAHQLKVLFGLLDNGHLVGSSVRKQRREARLGRRVHPFPFFRDGADDAEPTDQPDDEITPIAKYFDGGQMCARMLLSDGRMLNADAYAHGPDGFIIATWHDPKVTWATDVLNRCFDGKCFVVVAEPLAAKAPRRPLIKGIKKRPTTSLADSDVAGAADECDAAGATDDCDAAGVADEGDAARLLDEAATEDEWLPPTLEEGCELESQMTLRVRPGHDTAMTITVQSGLRGGKDKAQIMEVKAEQLKGTRKSPREVCESVIALLEKDIKLYPPPAAGAPWLKDVRALAKRYRAAIVELEA
jgi:hypothetical protein